MGPRNPDEQIGEFQTLAFVLNKRFKQAQVTSDAASDLAIAALQTVEEQKALEEKDMRRLFITCNTV